MHLVDRAASLFGAAVGGGFAGSGCCVLATYAVVPAVIRLAAGGQYPGKSAHVWLWLMCLASGAVVGAGVGVIARSRRLRRVAVPDAVPGTSPFADGE